MSPHELPSSSPIEPIESQLTPAQEREMERYQDLEGLSAYDARVKTLGYFPAKSEVTLAVGTTEEVGEDEPTTIARPERMTIMKQDYGFYPTSLRELSEAFNVKDFNEHRGGAARHLQEIALHQVKHEADPVKATVSVTSEFGLYAQQARTEQTALLQLRSELFDADAHIFSSADAVAVTGREQLVRYLDASTLSQRHTAEDATEPFERQSEAYVADRLARLRVGQARALVEEAIKDKRARFNFWITQVEAISRYQTGAARVVAKEILYKLNVTSHA